MTMEMLALAAASIGVVLLCGAALHDVAARTVPNGLAAAVAVCGAVAQAAQGGLGWSLGAGLAVFVAAALMWRRGWMGGGDVKLLGAAALLVPAGSVPSMLAVTALAGGALALPYALARRRLRRPRGVRPAWLVSRAWRVERWRLGRGGPMPYAVAIAFGALFVLTPSVSGGAGGHAVAEIQSGGLP